MSANLLILHVDADAFFASVEQAIRPELRGHAVIVGGSDRGVVSAASYEARRFGVNSAMPMVQARKLCPHAVFVDANFQAYSEFSDRMFAIMRTYSPMVEATSIDEGYADLTGTLRLHRAPPWEIAHRLLCEIRSTLGINVSGGLAKSKIWAKMATGLAKPNGLLYLEPEPAADVLWGLPVGSIPGVGKKAEGILKGAEISTVGELARANRQLVSRLLGKWGEKLIDVASGDSTGRIHPEPCEARKSYSKDRTLEADTNDYLFIRGVARELAEKLAARLRADAKGASTVTFKVRYSDFVDSSRSMSLKEPTNENSKIRDCLDRLFWRAITRRTRIRQVGVKLSGIDRPSFQASLFDPADRQRRDRDRAVDAIRARFGFNAVRVSGWN